MRRLLLLVVLTAAILPIPAANADRVTIPTGAPRPWTTDSPLELLAARIVNHIAGHPATVRCETYPGWHALGQSPAELGVVPTRYDVQTNRFVADATLIELAPQICLHLQQFAQAATKPTKCQPAAGAAPRPCFVGRPIGRVASVPGICSRGSCFETTAHKPQAYWQSYHQTAEALLTLAHEAIHVQQSRAGATVPSNAVVETQATCSGMQWLPWVATQFGDTSEDAQALARFEWLLDYPLEATLTEPYARSHPYWSPACRPGGSLDVRAPGSTFWP